MATDRLKLYNEALRICGERNLASLAENREPRRLLDQVWDNDGVRYCLEAGQWQFAMRAVKLDYSPSVEPPFGFKRAFDKPVDMVRTTAVAHDEYFRSPLLDYTDEAGFLFADLDTIYLRYVSDDNAYGNDLSLWPASFTKFAAAYFASEIVTKLTSDEGRWNTAYSLKSDRLRDALAKDAMQEPTQFAPRGSWTSARLGNWTGRDRGRRGSLIG